MTTLAEPIGVARAPVSIAAGMRLREIDMLRGLVIVIMALDHVRDYFFLSGGFAINPLDPALTTPALYVTRWITHLCAPTFVFLSGVSAWLQHAKGKTGLRLAGFLATRGLWLIFLECTVLSFGWSFGFPYPFFLQVIWAIGWSMIALSALVLLPRPVVLGIGVAIIALHNLLDPIQAQSLGAFAVVGQFLHTGGPVMVGGHPIGLIAYPVLPWIGVIALGYGAGPLFLQPPEKRDRALFALGASMLGLFFVLRGLNAYGDSSAGGGPFSNAISWPAQPTLGGKIMRFFDVEKYPPSLDYVLVTLGLVAVLFPLLRRVKGAPAHVLAVFGAVPFFFYLLHVYVVHGLAVLANALTGRDPGGQFNFMMNTFLAPEKLQGLGFPLPGVWAFWIVVVALMYWPCRWWAGVKSRRRDWWLSYL